MKTIYFLRTRLDESEPWNEPEVFATRKERNDTEKMVRCLGGIRTHSYEKKVGKEQAEALIAGEP